MVFPNANFIDKTFMQIFTKASWVRFGKADVFVEVEHFHALPVDAGSAVKASRNSNCDAPVAAMMRALLRSAIESRMIVPARAAAAASDFLVREFVEYRLISTIPQNQQNVIERKENSCRTELLMFGEAQQSKSLGNVKCFAHGRLPGNLFFAWPAVPDHERN